MGKATEISLGNPTRHLLVLLLLLVMQLCACAEKKEAERKRPIGIITTTSYCLSGITAADVKVKAGFVALSRDIEKKHRLKFGDLIYVEGEAEPYIFMDRMPVQWKMRSGSLYQ